jgi:hypothetical protein
MSFGVDGYVLIVILAHTHPLIWTCFALLETHVIQGISKVSMPALTHWIHGGVLYQLRIQYVVGDKQ